MSINHQADRYLNLILEREKGIIKFSSTVIKSNVGIYNFPRGFGRKFMFTDIITKELFDWGKEDKYKYVQQEERYSFSEIKKQRLFLAPKTNYTILVCNDDDIISWKYCMEVKNVEHTIFKQKKNIEIIEDENKVIIANRKTFSFLIDNVFCDKAIKRLIITDPELIECNNFIKTKKLFFGFCWVLCTSPAKILSLNEKHFIYNFIPFNLDSFVFNAIQICQNIKVIKENDNNKNLREIYKLPSFNKIEHTYREEMFRILSSSIDENIFNLFDAGKTKEAMEQLTSINFTNENENIYKHVYDKIKLDIKEEEDRLKIIQFQHDNSRLLNKSLKNIEILKTKQKELSKKLTQFFQNTICIICNFQINSPMLLCCCQNSICSECIITWLTNDMRSSCPFCREHIHNDDIIPFNIDILDSNSNIEVTESISTCNLNLERIQKNIIQTRENTIFSLIENITCDKNEIALFFCESDEINKKIIKECCIKNIFCIEFTGGLSDRQEIFSNIQKNYYKLVVVSNFRDLLGFHFLNINEIISFSNLDDYKYEFLCSRFYRIHRKKNFNFHTFKFVSYN